MIMHRLLDGSPHGPEKRGTISTVPILLRRGNGVVGSMQNGWPGGNEPE